MYFIRVGDKGNLEYHCKQCSFSEEYYNDIKDCCIYNHKIENDHSVQDISINNYITKDPTLPRLTNLKCVNDKCLTNTYIPNSILVYGIYNTSDKFDPENFIEFIKTDILKDNGIDLQLTKLDDKMVILTFESKEILDENMDKMRQFEYNNTDISCSLFLHIKPEIIFIKYDSINMKYLYICSTCNTSWKNN